MPKLLKIFILLSWFTFLINVPNQKNPYGRSDQGIQLFLNDYDLQSSIDSFQVPAAFDNDLDMHRVISGTLSGLTHLFKSGLSVCEFGEQAIPTNSNCILTLDIPPPIAG